MANFAVFYPPAGAGSANASVGINGADAPTSSTQVAGENPSGDLQPLQTDAAGNLLVNIKANDLGPIHVIVDSSALPSGAATSVNQTTANSSLSSIDTKTAALGQAAMAASSPVVIASNQSAVPVSMAAVPTGGATAANQATEIASLSSIDTKTPALGQALAAASTPVVLTAAQISTLTPLSSVTVTQATGTNLHVVVDSSGLPSGAATETTQLANGVLIGAVNETAPASDTASSGLNGRLQRIAQRLTSLIALFPTSLGQKTSAASLAVVIASDQSAVTTATTDATATGNITIQNSNPNSGVATAGSTVSLNLSGQNTISVQVTGTYTGALTPQVTVDGTNWIALSATAVTNTNTNAQAATIASGTAGIFEISTPPSAQFRISANASVTGTAVINIRATAVAGRVGLDSPIPAGTAIIGALSANQSVNTAQINGVAPTMGNGVSGTGVQRVTIASDSTGAIRLSSGAFANAPIVSSYSGTPVTSAAYVQLVASTTSAATGIEIFDSSGQPLYLAIGAAASEVNQFIIYPGGNGRIPYPIAASSRISIKAVSTSATSGQIIINLYQ